MQKSRIILTNHQLDFAKSPEYPLIKHAIIQNIWQHFNELGQELKANSWLSAPKEYKLTKGENLQFMPYVVLDFPQLKANEIDIATRTLFWWGNYISLNLIMKKEFIKDGVIEMPETLYVQTDENLWNNKIKEGYQLQSHIDKSELPSDYVRIVKTLNIADIGILSNAILDYKKWIDLLGK